MYKGIAYEFIIPWLLLLAVAIGIGVRIGKRDGAKRAFGMAALTIGIGGLALAVLFVIYLVIYYANGGH